MTGNRLLDALAAPERSRLMARMTPIPLTMKHVLHQPGQPISTVLFPTEGVISLITQLRSGIGVEMATIGTEGMLGVPIFLADTTASNLRALVQVPGAALRMDARDFAVESAALGGLRQVMQRYTHALLTQAAQEIACNRMHTTRARCARWLLMTHDRVSSDEFPITQEFLAEMLGVRRASVSVAMGALQKTGTVEYERGWLRVADRPGLEGVACECYEVIREEFERLLPELPDAD